MSKSNTTENDILKLYYNGTPIANIADNAASSPLTSLYLAFHTADPGEAGDQTTSECTYTGYARVAVLRSTSGFTASTAGSTSPVANVDLPACTAGTNTATHFSFGVAASGASKIIHSGTLTPNISISNGVTPRLSNATTITED